MNKKILVSAYGCEPFRGSEAGVGWNWVIQMAKKNELYVITRLNDKQKIEENIPNDVRGSLHFYYYDTNKILMKVKNKDKRLYLYYFFWQIGIIKIVRKLKKEIEFDYSMHLTFGSFWMPTFLPFFDIPFIWGPIGGGDSVPKAYIKKFPLKQRLVQTFRYILIRTSAINPLVFIPARKAVAIICRTKNNIEVIPKKYRKKVEIMLETAMEGEVFDNKKNYLEINDEVEVIITGRLIPLKNINAAIDAINKIKNKVKIHLTIIGKGEEKKHLEEMICNYQLEKQILIEGQIPREELLKRLCKADIYFFPSLKEGGSWALMEGMAVGLPVVCLDWTGMGIITDDASAIRVKPSNYEQTVDEFAEALLRLSKDRELRQQMGLAGRNRIRDVYNWEIKGDYMEQLLEKIERQENETGNNNN